MRNVACVAILLALPVPAAAAGGGEGGFSFATSLAQMLGSLAVVVGLIYLITHLSRRWLKGGFGTLARKSHIRIVETRHLSPKKSLLLVEVAGEYLLLSNGSEGVSLIKQIDMHEQVEVLEVPNWSELPENGRFQERLDGIMAKLNPPCLMTFEPRNR